MAKRRRKRRMSPELKAEWRHQRLRDLPPGVPVEYFGELCQGVDRCLVWGCKENHHSRAATVEWILGSDCMSQAEEILAWLDSIDCRCDCAVRDRGLRRVQWLCRGLDEEEP